MKAVTSLKTSISVWEAQMSFRVSCTLRWCNTFCFDARHGWLQINFPTETIKLWSQNESTSPSLLISCSPSLHLFLNLSACYLHFIALHKNTGRDGRQDVNAPFVSSPFFPSPPSHYHLSRSLPPTLPRNFTAAYKQAATAPPPSWHTSSPLR